MFLQHYVPSYSESVQWNFFILITWRSSSSKSAAVYNISWKSNDFSLRYGDISIFKMAAVRHLGIVLPPYETTHEVSVAGCSCLSNLMSIWYTDSEDIGILIFRIFRLKCLFRPQNWGFGGLWTTKCDYSSSRPPKGSSLRKSASFKLSTVWRSDDSPSVIPNWEWTSLTLMNVIVTYLLYCTVVWFCMLVHFRR